MNALATAPSGIGSFHVHRGHAFEGFELRPDGYLAALCSCGATLDVARAVFTTCPDCLGVACPRCGGSGSVVDHAALEWRRPATRS